MQLVLVSRLTNPKFAREFTSVCTYVNYAASNDTVRDDVKWTTMTSVQPDLVEYRQELYHKAFTCVRMLTDIDTMMMSIVRERSGTKELWTDTSALIKLAEKRSQVNLSPSYVLSCHMMPEYGCLTHNVWILLFTSLSANVEMISL